MWTRSSPIPRRRTSPRRSALAVPIDSLTLDSANARTHDEKNLAAIKGSLSRFGQRLPLVVQKQGMVVRAGNGRLMAAKELGWAHIAAVIVDESEVEATAFAIADNRSGELAMWDDEALAKLLQSLPDDAFAATGFSTDDLSDLLDSLAGPEVIEDEVPAPPDAAATQRGERVLGDHVLLCGDSSIAADVDRLLGGNTLIAAEQTGRRAFLMELDPLYADVIVQRWEKLTGRA